MTTLLRAAVFAVATLACARAESTPAAKSPAAAVPGAATAATPAGDSTSRSADRGRILGDSTAKVWMIMISDFQCPYCKQWHDQTFEMVRKEYVETGKLRLAFLNLPLPMHPNAHPAAEAAMCSAAQGKFWPMHDALFASQDRWAKMADPAAAFDSLATAAGVNVAAMRACIKSGATKALIEQDQARASEAGARATPSFVIGDSMIEGAVGPAQMRASIDSILARSARPAAK